MLFKRLISALAAVVLVFSCTGTAFAAQEGRTDFTVSVDSVTALPGDSVMITVNIADNPGIMAVTVTLHYDPSVLQYEKYYAGMLPLDTVVTHPEGYTSIVYCGKQNRYGDGKLFSIKMKVADNASAGEYPLTVKNSRCEDTLKGAFANFEGMKLLPVSVPSTLTVGYNGTNCEHSFSSYTDTVPPTCTESGISTRSCTVCGHTQTRETAAMGHSFSDDWVIDSAATQENSGVASKHCEHCLATRQKLRFTLSEAAEYGFSNTVGTVIYPDKWETADITEAPDENDTSAEVPSASPPPQNQASNSHNPSETVADSTSPEQSVTADELVEQAKGEQAGPLTRLWLHLFGKNGDGILSVITASAHGCLSSVVTAAAVLLLISAVGFIF